MCKHAFFWISSVVDELTDELNLLTQDKFTAFECFKYMQLESVVVDIVELQLHLWIHFDRLFRLELIILVMCDHFMYSRSVRERSHLIVLLWHNQLAILGGTRLGGRCCGRRHQDIITKF